MSFITQIAPCSELNSRAFSEVRLRADQNSADLVERGEDIA